MTYYNNGTFETEDEETMKELLRIIDEVGLGTATCGEADQYRLDDKFYLELTDCIGDIEVSLKEIVDVCEKADLKISFLITYCGDAEGAYSYLNGVYETLGEEELHLRNVSNESLIAEIARRGLFQSAEIMRTDYNCGSFEAESEEDLKKLIRVINEIGLGTARYSVPLLTGSLTYLGKLVRELLHTTIGTPVIDFVTGTDDETAAQSRVFLRLEDHIVSLIFLLYKITDIL